MSFKCFLWFKVAFLFVISFCGLTLSSFAEATEYSEVVSAEADAETVIATAEESIVVCYQAVADADKAGANTTALVVKLNEAGELLSKAKLAIKVDDFDSALSLALLSQEKLNDFVGEANALKEKALGERYRDFIVNSIGSLVGAIAVVLGSFVAWSFLRRKYGKNGEIVG